MPDAQKNKSIWSGLKSRKQKANDEVSDGNNRKQKKKNLGIYEQKFPTANIGTNQQFT